MKNKRTPLNSFIIAVIAILLTILYSKSFPEQSFCKCNVCYRYLTVISAGSVRLFQT